MTPPVEGMATTLFADSRLVPATVPPLVTAHVRAAAAAVTAFAPVRITPGDAVFIAAIVRAH